MNYSLSVFLSCFLMTYWQLSVSSCRDLLVFLDLKVLLDSVVLLVCLDREEREDSLAFLDLL